MFRTLNFYFFFFLILTLPLLANRETLPVAYQGRIRPAEAYSRLWLKEFYGKETLNSKDLPEFKSTSSSALTFLWKLHLLGHHFFKDAPLFFIESNAIKTLLSLDPSKTHYSYETLKKATFIPLLESLITSEFQTLDLTFGKNTYELTALSQGLWVSKQEGGFKVVKTPLTFPWNLITKTQFSPHKDTLSSFKEEALSLILKLEQFSHIPGAFLGKDLLFPVLIPKNLEGKWLPFSELTDKTKPLYLFASHRKEAEALYESAKQIAAKNEDKDLEEKLDQLAKIFEEEWQTLAGQPFLKTVNKQTFYPSFFQLKLEVLYYQIPFLPLCLLLYGLTLLGVFVSEFWKKRFFISAFFFHSLFLLIRGLILKRPPVSNMLETVLFVPWVTVALSFFLSSTAQTAAAVVAFSLLSTLFLLDLHPPLDSVQAVLDSQFWLTLHVLLVVGSYGLFALGTVLGHLYLFESCKKAPSSFFLAQVTKTLFSTLCIGVFLLITGTLLGGVWAAQSWGRFWDWDPKESWAFISSCAYLLCIHAYFFGKIKGFGLSLCSIFGFFIISFTWYGVNYILGTGLHSYGFGAGGEAYYLTALIVDLLLVTAAVIRSQPISS